MQKMTNPLIMFFALVFLPVLATAADRTFFYHTDPAGTPLAMTDSSGAVGWKADYKPFGEENSLSGAASNDRRFVGKEKDEETGLSYFGARYEDAKTGRFIAPDPVRGIDAKTSKTNEKILLNPQRLNTYVYGLNNPYRYVDPDGRDAWDIGFFLYSVFNFAKEPSRGNAVYLGLDTIGLIPIVPALGTIARVGKGAERAIEATAIGTKISHGHAFDKHIGEFNDLGIGTRGEFSSFISGILKNAKGSDVKQLQRGRTAYWDAKTNTTVIHDPKHADLGTAFRSTQKYFENLR